MPAGRREQELDVVVADERAPEQRGRGSEQREAGDRYDAAAAEEDEDGTERSHERSGLGGIGVLHGARTLRGSW